MTTIVVRQSRLTFALILSAVCAVQMAAAQQSRREFVFHGTVTTVNPGARTLTVSNDNIDGWMPAMTMTYTVDKPEVLGQLKTGDRITATVYDGNFTTLFGVRVAAATPAGSAPSASTGASTGLPPLSYTCTSPGKKPSSTTSPGSARSRARRWCRGGS